LHVFAWFAQKPEGTVSLDVMLADGRTVSQKTDVLPFEEDATASTSEGASPSTLARLAVARCLADMVDEVAATERAIRYQLMSEWTNYIVVHARAEGEKAGERVTWFYNQRGKAEQYIKEGKNAIKWTRLSCRKFRDNAVRLQLHALAYNLANFMRTLALPKEVEHWSLTTLREKLVKIGAKVVRHDRYVTFQLAEVAVPRELFRKILSLIDDLRRRPAPA
jgi:hypothetical protein